MAACLVATLATFAVFTIVAWDESPVILEEPEAGRSEELVDQMLDLAKAAQSSTREAAGNRIEKELVGHDANLETQAAQVKKKTDEDMALWVQLEDHNQRSAAAPTALSSQEVLEEDGEESFVPYQDLVATMLKLEKEASKGPLETLDQIVDTPVDPPAPSAESPGEATDEVDSSYVVKDDELKQIDVPREVEPIDVPDEGRAVVELLLEKEAATAEKEAATAEASATKAASAAEKPTTKDVTATANSTTKTHTTTVYTTTDPKTTQSKAEIAENAVTKAAKTEKKADRAEKKTQKAAAESTSAMIDAAKAHHAAQEAKQAATSNGDAKAIASALALEDKADAKIKDVKRKSKKAERRTKKFTTLLTKAKKAEMQASAVSPAYLVLQAKLDQTEGMLQNQTAASNSLRQQLEAQSATMKKMEQKLQKGTQNAHAVAKAQKETVEECAVVSEAAKTGTKVQQELQQYKTKLHIAQTALTTIYQAVGSKLAAESVLQS